MAGSHFVIVVEKFCRFKNQTIDSGLFSNIQFIKLLDNNQGNFKFSLNCRLQVV